MSNLVITVESGSDLTEEMARQYGIFIVPMYVQFKDETRADGSFPASDVCRYFKETGKVPKTSGSSPEDYRKVFDEIHRRWPEKKILHLAYSAVTTVARRLQEKEEWDLGEAVREGGKNYRQGAHVFSARSSYLPPGRGTLRQSYSSLRQPAADPSPDRAAGRLPEGYKKISGFHEKAGSQADPGLFRPGGTGTERDLASAYGGISGGDPAGGHGNGPGRGLPDHSLDGGKRGHHRPRRTGRFCYGRLCFRGTQILDRAGKSPGICV